MERCEPDCVSWEQIAEGTGSENDESLQCEIVLKCLACARLEIEYYNPTTDKAEYRYYVMESK